MARIEIREIGQDKIDRVNAILGNIRNGSGVFEAMGSALKRAAKAGEHEAGRYAAETYNITQQMFRNRCKIKYSLSSGGTGQLESIEITFAGAVIPLIEFKGTSGGPQGGVRVGPKMGGASLRTAFIQTIYSKGVWERVGRKRFPVEQLYGPSTGHMMQDNEVSDKVTNRMLEVFDSRIEHEITRILNGW